MATGRRGGQPQQPAPCRVDWSSMPGNDMRAVSDVLGLVRPWQCALVIGGLFLSSLFDLFGLTMIVPLLASVTSFGQGKLGLVTALREAVEGAGLPFHPATFLTLIVVGLTLKAVTALAVMRYVGSLVATIGRTDAAPGDPQPDAGPLGLLHPPAAWTTGQCRRLGSRSGGRVLSQSHDPDRGRAADAVVPCHRRDHLDRARGGHAGGDRAHAGELRPPRSAEPAGRPDVSSQGSQHGGEVHRCHRGHQAAAGHGTHRPLQHAVRGGRAGLWRMRCAPVS